MNLFFISHRGSSAYFVLVLMTICVLPSDSSVFPEGFAFSTSGRPHSIDPTGLELPTRLELKGNSHAIVIAVKEAVFPIEVDPLLTSPIWTAESNQANARFGASVASAGDVNGDGCSDGIIGAPE